MPAKSCGPVLRTRCSPPTGKRPKMLRRARAIWPELKCERSPGARCQSPTGALVVGSVSPPVGFVTGAPSSVSAAALKSVAAILGGAAENKLPLPRIEIVFERVPAVQTPHDRTRCRYGEREGVEWPQQ